VPVTSDEESILQNCENAPLDADSFAGPFSALLDPRCMLYRVLSQGERDSVSGGSRIARGGRGELEDSHALKLGNIAAEGGEESRYVIKINNTGRGNERRMKLGGGLRNGREKR
jgi:hypothetical protein